jgi:hypothetical protein
MYPPDVKVLTKHGKPQRPPDPTGAQRQRQCTDLKVAGLRHNNALVPTDALAEAMMIARGLTEDEALDERVIDAELSDMICEWIDDVRRLASRVR